MGTLNHYSIRGKMGNIIQSFLSDRYQSVSISNIQSVIQGSKLLAILYTLYINEVTILHSLVNRNIYNIIT